jgi:hypothetical protein
MTGHPHRLRGEQEWRRTRRKTRPEGRCLWVGLLPTSKTQDQGMCHSIFTRGEFVTRIFKMTHSCVSVVSFWVAWRR